MLCWMTREIRERQDEGGEPNTLSAFPEAVCWVPAMSYLPVPGPGKNSPSANVYSANAQAR